MTTTFRVNGPDVIHETIDDEVILIDLKTGTYYSLRDAGSVVWQSIERGADEQTLVSSVRQRYEGTREEIELGVRDLLAELQRERLIRADGVPAGGDGAAAVVDGMSASRLPFSAPTLEKHTDMQDLILIDPVHEVSAAGWPNLPEATEASA